ncbi:MAG: serine/threonine-protein kinase [Myxococcota bacterium]|jgi:tRNA A-37 threonylcarbamoyl transferase component Bud32|nr:serine/threonine-protein kinase [Myxococcota bacterium]
MSSGSISVGALLSERYELTRMLGAGGFGEVFQAFDQHTQQSVAIKLLREGLLDSEHGQREMSRFQREAQTLAKLRHPNLVRLIDTGHFEGRFFIVIEYIEGQSLDAILHEQGPLEPVKAIHLMSQVLDALCAAHEQGVVHRDLKPANIMISSTGARANAMVLDFGIAGIVEDARGADYATLSVSGRVTGSPAYMAPEQFDEGAGRLRPAIDLYAWGLIFIEALSGRPVVEGDSILQLIKQQLDPAPVSLPEALRGLPVAAVIERAVAKDPAQRYRSAREALAELDALGGRSLQTEAVVETQPAAAASPSNWRWVLWSGGVVLVLVLGVGLWLALRSKPEQASSAEGVAELDCEAPRVPVAGHCCWPGQRVEGEACVGQPSACPGGLVASSSGCAPVIAVEPDPEPDDEAAAKPCASGDPRGCLEASQRAEAAGRPRRAKALEQLAAGLASRSCAKGEQEGCAVEGLLKLRMKPHTPERIRQGLDKMEAACDAGVAAACRDLRQLYLGGYGLIRADAAKAAKALQRYCALQDGPCELSP